MRMQTPSEIEVLDDNQRTRALGLHQSAVVINALDATRLAQGDGVYMSKLKRSGVTAINHSVSTDGGLTDALLAIQSWWKVYAQFPEDVIVATKYGDISRAKAEGKVAVFFGFQDTKALEGNLALLDIFYAIGLRFLQLTYQHRNLVGDGCGERTNAGLSTFGRQVVRRMNELGVVVDLSHVGIATTLDAIEASDQPVTITHATARKICDTIRGKTDEEIKALAAKGGVMGIAAMSGFLKPNGAESGATLDDYVDHIDYVRDLVGIDHVGIGTDIGDERGYTRDRWAKHREKYPEIPFIGSSLQIELMHPRGLGSPDQLLNITGALVRRGYSDEEIVKVLGANFLRVFRAVMRP